MHAEGRVAVHTRRRHMRNDGFKERGHVARADVGVVAGVAVQAGGVNDGEIELFVGGAEAVKEVKGFVQYPVGTRTGAVDFVDDDDGMQSHVEGFLGDEAGLWHRAVHGVHQQENAVNHGEDALDFAAEVGVSGGINDVDLVVFPADGGVFRHDGDAAFAFEVHGVHHAFVHFGALGEGVGLAEELVNQGGFAMVYVGDDGDVADFFDVVDICHGSPCCVLFFGHKERRMARRGMARIIRARSLLGEFFLQKRVHRFRVGLALRTLQHLAGEEAEHFRLPVAVGGDLLRMSSDNFIHPGCNLAVIVHLLQALRGDERVGRFHAFPQLRQQFFASGGGDGVVLDAQ